MQYYVDINVKAGGNGSKEAPFTRINDAAAIAEAGDEIIVCDGVYRENVNPRNAGTKRNRITYRAMNSRKVIITGARKIDNWENVNQGVWMTRINNSIFNDYNPYTTLVYGDWLDQGRIAHTGEVYLNDKSLYEVDSRDKIDNPPVNEETWDPDFAKYVWYTEQDYDSDETVLYANFHEYNPNEENIEINVLPNCFFPKKEHVDYITVSGFVFTKAATNWAPPTAFQDGMVGPHWSKGWIIEDCEISNSKCSGISLGKYKQENNDNKWTKLKYKDGSQTQRDCSLIAQLDGWSKETIGSHIVRNCHIHDCGQTGIVGNLGCVFSVIENNYIHHINNKRNLAGAEIGGIKLHAAIDVILKDNHFHHCTRGVWLDWQAQGTRVTGNLFHDNCMPFDHLLKEENKAGLGFGEDLFIEIAHGPTLVDNNIFLSERAIKLPTQGVAFVHNLFYGAISAVGRGVKNGSEKYDSTRYTPYHIPHRTEIVGFMSVLHGDVRFYNNVFVQPKVRDGVIALSEPMKDDQWDDGNLIAGTCPFNGFMSEEEWKSHFDGYCGEGADDSRDKYYMPLPVWSDGNVYFNGAKPCDLEKDAYVDETNMVNITLKCEKDGSWLFESNYKDFLPNEACELITSDTLGMAFEPEERFETPEGEDIIFDTDIFGCKRLNGIIQGPFA